MTEFNGGNRNNKFVGGSGDDVAFGNGGNDKLHGGAGSDLLDGGAGDDALRGGTGLDRLYGGDGDDLFEIRRNNDVVSGEVYDGGSGYDTLQFNYPNQHTDLSSATLSGIEFVGAGIVADVGITGEQLSALSGFAGGFRLTTGGTITIDGDRIFQAYIRLAPVDTTFDLSGIANLDIQTGPTVVGGDGNDTIIGSTRNDYLRGGSGDDVIAAGDGDDILENGAGSDIMDGGAGDDMLFVRNPAETFDGDTYRGGAGDDTLSIPADADLDISALKLVSVEHIQGGGFSGRVSLTAHQLDGLTSIDAALTLTTGGSVSLDDVAFNNGAIYLSAEGNRLDASNLASGALNMLGGAGDDVVIGSVGQDNLGGGDGGDSLNGLAGGDFLSGGDGDDSLDGSAGADEMIGGAGNDRYFVDDSGDTVTEDYDSGVDTVQSSVDYALGDYLENLSLTGSARIGAGNGMNNRIAGSDGDDMISGGGGDDLLLGGLGTDILTGGSGADNFRFAAGDTAATVNAADVITDFSHADGDKINLSAIDAIAATPENDAFRFIGTTGFSGTAGELRYHGSHGDTLVLGDTDGDKVADLVIKLTGTVALAASDFALGNGSAFVTDASAAPAHLLVAETIGGHGWAAAGPGPDHPLMAQF